MQNSRTHSHPKGSSRTQGYTNYANSYNKTGLIELLTHVSTKQTKETQIIDNNMWLNVSSTELKSLKECACLNSKIFDRTSNNRRVGIEKRIIQNTKNRFSLEKHHNLNYLSLGAGFLLQDFIICAYLLLNGYSLCVRLVEHSCESEQFREAYQQFCCLQLYAEGMKLQFVVAYFPTILAYIKQHPLEQIDIGQAIDFDAYHFHPQSKMDLHFACQKLAHNGFLYFAIFHSDYILSSSSPPEYIHRDSLIERGKDYDKTNKTVIRTENEIACAMNITPSYITKNILTYIGLFNLKEPIKQGIIPKLKKLLFTV
jgi:hypothetical protein